MTRTGKACSWLAGLLIVALAGIVLFIALFDWNRLKPMINQKVSQELNRPFAIRGDLGVDWARQPSETGWRAWVPWPHLHAGDIVLGNPENIPGGEMVTLQRVDASLAPLALLKKELYIPRIWLKGPDASLKRLANGDNNWTFHLANTDRQPAGGEKASSWSFRLDDIVFDQGKIAYDDASLRANFRVTVDPLGKPLPFSEVTGDSAAAKKINAKGAAPYVFGWRVDGTYRGETLAGSGKVGGMLALRDPDGLFPVQADVRSGKTRVAVVGTLSDPLNLGALDLRLRFSGESLDQLQKLTGILLPRTPPYATDGHLTAQLRHAGGAQYRYQDFNGRIGDSDIHGSLTYQTGKPRPRLSGELVSNQLRFADLAPLIGADSNPEKAARGEPTRQPSDKVLPVEKFDTRQWSTMDADVRFAAKRIEHGESLPLSDLSTHLKLDDGVLLLDPLRFGVAGGNLNSTLLLEGNRTPMQGRVELHARGFRLQKLFPAVAEMKRSLGQLNGDARFSGRGNSVAELLATANGDVRLLINDGVISRSLMELAGLNVGNYVVSRLFGDDEVKINCAAADVGVRNGLATPRLFVFDTENAVVNITGTVNMATERLDLSVEPDSKGLRILTLRSPLYVKGTFKHPDAGVKAGPLIARGAAAVALGAVVAPAAALLALISPSEADSNQCGVMLNKMKK